MVATIPEKTLTFEKTIHAPAAQVYQSFTNRDWVRDWFADDAHLRAEEGGHILFTWYSNYYAVGRYLKLEENERITFTWRGAGEDIDCEIDIHLSKEDGATHLTLTRSGPVFNEEAVQREWDSRLDNLKLALETGADGRITNRVIIGIIPENVDEGVRVTQLVPDLSAEKAGLKPGDIVTHVDGQEITPQKPINVLMGNKKPGDEVEISYQRDGVQHHAIMPLVGYPVPEAAADFIGLSERLAGLYDAIKQDLRALYANASPEKAAHRPAAGEWSANDVVAHLILTERWLQNFIGGLLQGPEPSGYTANTQARIDGLVQVYPTADAILAAYEASLDETVALVRAMPADALERKTNLWWTTFELHQLEQHARQHLNQIADALAN
jgi:uncharacterized protein YndB with AHSA1/START domain